MVTVETEVSSNSSGAATSISMPGKFLTPDLLESSILSLTLNASHPIECGLGGYVFTFISLSSNLMMSCRFEMPTYGTSHVPLKVTSLILTIGVSLDESFLQVRVQIERLSAASQPCIQNSCALEYYTLV